MKPPSPIKASQMAELCDCDLKTIHNWIVKKRLKARRTPGGHIRIERADAVRFLKKWGFHVPDELKAKRKPACVEETTAKEEETPNG